MHLAHAQSTHLLGSVSGDAATQRRRIGDQTERLRGRMTILYVTFDVAGKHDRRPVCFGPNSGHWWRVRRGSFDLSRVPDDAEWTGRSGRRSSAVDGRGTVAVAMFITVKFGENESLLCNPSCAVINLLNSIRRRAGYANTNVCLDLSDETGKRKVLIPRQPNPHARWCPRLRFRNQSLS